MKNGKITVDAGDDEKTLKIDADRNTIFNLIDLYGATVNVQNKELIPKYNILKDINITETLNLLQGSTVSFDNVDFHDAKISIYNSEPEDPEKPLLSFDKQINEQPSKISIFKSEEGKILEDDNIVLINQQDSIFIEEQCNQWANKIAGGDYNQKQCVPDEKEKNRKLVVQKESNSGGGKKNKLSGGAIAGIVIACVVVVAAIIALFVYFLVIKKKNASTTSTQGDSSIAIKI